MQAAALSTSLASVKFPEQSTQYQYWTRRTVEELQSVRRQANADALVKLKVPEELAVTPHAEFGVVKYFVCQLIHVCTEKKLDYRVTSTAASFFRRFYQSRSVLEHDPRKILFTCIVLALKVEDQSHYIPLKQITDGLESLVDVAELFAKELVVLDALSFQLLVLHVRNPLHFLTTDYFQWKARGLSAYDLQDLERRVSEVNTAAERLSLRLYYTDIPFLYSPAQQALACFLHCSGGGQLAEAEAFVESVLRKQPQIAAAVKSKLRKIVEEIVVLCEVDGGEPGGGTEEERSSVLKTLKSVDRVQRRLLKGTSSSGSAVGESRKKKKRKTKPIDEASSAATSSPGSSTAATDVSQT